MTKETTAGGFSQSQLPLIIIGVLWLLLAGYIFYTQYSAPKTITITWETESEYDTAGFNIYRSESPEGEFVQINPQLIPSQADPASGASYTFVDENVEPGRTYYYKLEDVEYSNARQQHDIIQHNASQPAWWIIALAAVSLVLGIALITTAVKETRRL